MDTGYDHCLPCVCPDPNPDEEVREDVKRSMQHVELVLSNESVVHIKYVARSCTNAPRSSTPVPVAPTTIPQWRIMAPTDRLNTMGDRGSPWVTPWSP